MPPHRLYMHTPAARHLALPFHHFRRLDRMPIPRRPYSVPSPPPPRPPVAQIAPAAMSCGSRSRVHPSRSRVVEVAGAPGAAALARRMAAGGAEAGCVGEHGLPAEAELQREVGP